jgi:DNA-binding transcriptional LysR family regulator
MQINQIKQVLEIYRTGSIYQAAQNLYISQPALSKSLRIIESELKNTIFVRGRGHGGVNLTPFGRMFVENARHAINSLTVIETYAENTNILSHQQFRVCASRLRIAGYAYSKIIDKYHRSLFSTSYLQASRSQVYSNIHSRVSDVGIIMLPYPYIDDCIPIFASAGIEYQCIARFPACIAVSNTNPLYHREEDTITLEELSDQTLYIDNEQMPLFQTLDEKIKNALGVKDLFYHEYGGLNYGMSFTHLEELCCVSDVNNLYAKIDVPLFPNELMRILHVLDMPFEYEYGYLCLQNDPLSPIALEFIDLLHEILKS